MYFCTSELCKSLVFLFAIVIAGYLIITNGRSKIKEYFEEDTTASPEAKVKTETASSSAPQKTASDEKKPDSATKTEKYQEDTECAGDAETDALISTIYKDVYKVDITEDKLKEYRKKYCLNKNNFDPVVFAEALKSDRVSELQDMVNDVFMQELGREATPEEMDTYVGAFLDGKLKSRDELVRLLANSPEKVNNGDIKPQAAQTGMDKNEYKLYKQIIDVFQKILDRSPNSAELNHYFAMVKADKTFTLDKLEDALIASREHNILVRNQKNVVQGELLGNITERQLQIVIAALYKSVYQHDPDKATFAYLRDKFIELNLDEEKMILFLKKLKGAEDAAFNGDVAPSDTTTNASSSYTQQANTYESYLGNKPNINLFTMEKPENANTDVNEERSVNVYDGKNKTANNVLGNSNDPGAIETDKVMNNIKTNARCSFDRSKVLELNNKQIYADYVNQRNQENCQDDSSRTSKYLNADNNMVLYPEFKWSVPQPRPPVCYSKGANYQPLVEQSALIGTLLTDAKQTQLGSILPDYTYKEKIAKNAS